MDEKPKQQPTTKSTSIKEKEKEKEKGTVSLPTTKKELYRAMQQKNVS